jgi:hypothetical protein
MKIVILPSARDDLESGNAFYESQEAGLGNYFWSRCSDIESVKLSTGAHPIVFGFHRSLCKRFPYAIYYSIASEKQATIWQCCVLAGSGILPPSCAGAQLSTSLKDLI